MLTTPSVSIVLPVYNGQRYLRKSIQSVLTQSHRNFELIIWDDGSEDESRSIMSSYRDPRVRTYTNQRNLGLFKTLNLAIGQAAGPLIRLWSQDDIMKGNCLEEELAFHDQYSETGMNYCLYDTIDDRGNVVRPAEYYPTPDLVSPALAAQIMFYHGSITGNIANVMLKREVLNSLGLFREDMRIAGDFEMWVRIAEKYPIGFLRKSLIFLRSHAEQFSRQRNSYVTCMSEEHTVYETLLKRQPTSELEYARKYARRHRYLKYVHHMIRSFLLGDFEVAIDSYRTIRRIDKPIKLLALWFITADQRLFKMPSKYTREANEQWQTSG